MAQDPYDGLRTREFSTSSAATDAKDSTMLKGEASDSLSGKNVTEQYFTTGKTVDGPLGGLASGK